MTKSDSRRVSEFSSKLISMDRVGAESILSQSREHNSPLEIVENLIVPALEKIGCGWENGTVALAQVYMGSRICEDLVDLFLPPSCSERISQPKMAIALLDDYHALGKMIVYASLRASGYELQDYGRLTSQELIQRICDDPINIILISTLMLRSALQIKEVRAGLLAAGLQTKIIVGGAPFRFAPELWNEVGADAWGTTAGEAVAAVIKCMEMSS
jgi:methanogenic corrinoid protein MtbC1